MQAPVITAVIDDSINPFNARFCRTEDGILKTRIKKYIEIQRPDPTGLFFQSSFSLTDQMINCLRDWAKGDEHDMLRVLDMIKAPGFGNCADLINFANGDARKPSDNRILSGTTRAGHGTHVLDIAAGANPLTAPDNRHIIAVALPKLALQETWGARLVGYIRAAIDKIFDAVDEFDPTIPLVINLSLGRTAGPKDGTEYLEERLGDLIDARNRHGQPTKLVISAGNAFMSMCHAQFDLVPERHRALNWQVQPEDHSNSFLELRATRMAELALTITPPGGPAQTIPLPAGGTTATWDWSEEDGTTLMRVYVEPKNDDHLVTLALRATYSNQSSVPIAPAGAYKLHVENTGAMDAHVSMDVQRDDTPNFYPLLGRQSYLTSDEWKATDTGAHDPELDAYTPFTNDSALTRSGTMSPFATGTGDHVFSVGGAYDEGLAHPHPERLRAARYSSAGPTRDNRPAPDLAAISEEGRARSGVLAAGTMSGGAAVFHGSSSAAPILTRTLAGLIAGGKIGGSEPKSDLFGHLPIIQPDPSVPALHEARIGLGVLDRAPRADSIPRRNYRP